MTISRRDVLKTLGTTTAVGTLGLPSVAGAVPLPDRIKTGKETTTICPYCGVGCTLRLHVQDGAITKATSPLENAITLGNLCVKGRFGWRFVQNR